MTASADNGDRATTEAASWLVLLDDDPDDVELRARFDAWLAASPANTAAWANTSDVYDMMARATPAHAAHWSAQAATDRQPASPPRPLPDRRMSPRRLLAVGMAAVAAACLALVFVPGIVLRLQADHVTSTAELRSFGLEDGSVVRLGPDSAIEIAKTDNGRRVHLLKGEAFFEVTRDPGRPFRVVVRDVETTVLGTSFNVRFAGEGAEVAVRSGLVRVDQARLDRAASRPAVAERLAPGDWVQVGWNGRTQRGAIPPEEVAPWLHGQIIARDRPLADVVDELRRYYGGAIVAAGGALADRRVTGVYNLSDPVAALRAIVGAHGGSVRQVSPWLLVVVGS
jgi:transmembrane sensor